MNRDLLPTPNNMRTHLTILIFFIVSGPIFCQGTQPTSSAQIKLISTGQVLQDLQQNQKVSKYYETSQDLIFLDENLIAALNAITPGTVSQENMDYMKYINSRDQKPYREVWDHNLYLKYAVTITGISQLLTDPATFSDLKKRLGREFNRLDPTVFINGSDRIMFILRSPGSEAGSFYRAILSNGSMRIDEISNWRDS
ncbi:MAG: hypothetical protein ACOYM0_05350 [Bacteroidales bacterium]